MGFEDAEENVNGLNKVVQVWVQTFVSFKAVLLLFYPTNETFLSNFLLNENERPN